MYYVRRNDRRWKVREAVSLNAALNAIASAMVSGSIGSKNTITEAKPGRPMSEWPTRVLADVIEVNSDLTECKAYQARY